MFKCPFCGSENTQYLPSNDGIHKKYEKEEKQNSMSYKVTGEHYYSISKAICMDCGYVFQKMSDETLKKYNEDRQFFIN